jgi:hypothetical protein
MFYYKQIIYFQKYYFNIKVPVNSVTNVIVIIFKLKTPKFKKPSTVFFRCFLKAQIAKMNLIIVVLLKAQIAKMNLIIVVLLKSKRLKICCHFSTYKI